MDRLELLRRWDERRNQSALAAPAQWLDWRIHKKLAKWTGRARKRQANLFWGQPMTIVYPENVSNRIGRHGYFEDDVTAMFLDVLRPGMVIYDIGSHYGFFSLLASEIVGATGQVLAWEPTPSTFALLSENADRRENITAVNLAAFSCTGSLRFLQQDVRDSSLNFVVHESESVDCPGAHVITVPAVALDDYVTEHPEPDFLKIDAEGAEGQILEGMIEIIKRSHPGISLEMGDRVNEKTGNRPCRENVEFLMDHGYQPFEYRNRQRHAHQIETRYQYKNLLFRHPQWRFMESGSAAQAPCQQHSSETDHQPTGFAQPR
ncbi:hypothetical protein K227x_63510 [Rubripirellula lacrimiformis]|uniref:Methyltransferase FkbM domain-containing protein n=1 Tax=Rubripirellula lacrimiformis TaxID=1930273 RepID=A0A517NLB6_9BACT|nr:FkbM family methyltransferase [Rubripirellula lacrimiformis]QDT07922.1 hypothetical protein K227x_63510 [Rubripirellula lacrimiformis]